jgi:glycosyltransferase involved in cell wall biosynthesis
MKNRRSPEYSLVIPVHNCRLSLKELVLRVDKVFAGLEIPYEIILVDDASGDQSWQEIRKTVAMNLPVTGIRLKNNVGQHRASLVGFWHCRGQRVITMDADLQQPPEEIPKLMRGLTEQVDVVIGSYAVTETSLWRRLGSWGVNGLLWLLYNKPLALKITSFKAFKRPIIQQLKQHVNHGGYLSAWLLQGMEHDRIGNVPVSHWRRAEGSSSYSLFRLFHLLGLIIRQFLWSPQKVPPYEIREILTPPHSALGEEKVKNETY